MHQVTSDELCVIQCDLTLWVTRLFSSGRKSNRIFGNRKDPAVGDSDLVGVASQIFDGITKAVKGFLNVRTPVLFIKVIFPIFPAIGITELLKGN